MESREPGAENVDGHLEFVSAGKRQSESGNSGDLERPSAKAPKLDSSALVCKQFLNSYATTFEAYLNLKALHPHLLECELLTHHEEDFLLNPSFTRVDKIQRLLLSIKQKGEVALLKFMQAIGRERTHYGHKELCKTLMQNLSDSEQIEFQELYKAVIDSQIDSNVGASSIDQATVGQKVAHSGHKLNPSQVENQSLHYKMPMVMDSQLVFKGTSSAESDHLTPLRGKLRHKYMLPKWSTINACDPKTHAKLNVFVKLALIKKSKPSTKEMLTDKFLQKTLHGLIDDILKKKESIEIENLFSRNRGQTEKLLVDGAPGIGKTELASHLCTMWAKGELLNQYELVIFVRLKCFQAKSADNELELYDLIKPYLSGEAGKNIAENLSLSGCINTLFILDGWDELPPSLREESSFFHSIISGDSGDFLDASVMVTSRSTVSNSLIPYVDKHVEVLGFDSEQVKEYVTFHVPQNKGVVLSHFKRFPNIQALSHIPLTLSIICSIVRDDDALPSTLTPLYDIYVRKVLLVNLKKHKQYQRLSSLRSLEDLPTEILSVIKSLAGLAWKGLAEDYLVFEKNDLEEVLDIDVLSDFDGYGLLTSIHYDDRVGESCLYQFCHLTVQEYLAAWHIAKLRHDEVQALLDAEHRFDYNPCKFHVVWKFFSGLTKLRDKNAQQAIISKTRKRSNIDVMLLLQCVYEADEPNVCAAAAAHLCRELHVDNKQLNAVDCLCIAYMLANAGGMWAVNMRGCNIGTDGLNTLYSNLIKQQKLSNVTPVTSFSKLDLSHNYLHLDTDLSGICKVAELITGPFIIKDLTLDFNDFGDQKISELAQAMCSKSTISSLCLANCGITCIGAQSLANMLVQNKFLKGLFLKFNKICDVGTNYFAEALKTNSTLSVLELGNNKIKENGFKNLCDMLKVNSGLKELRIEGVIVKQVQAQQLIEVLPYNNHLEALDLKKSGIGDTELKVLADGMKSNPRTTLKRLCFKGCNITDEGVKVLCELIADGLLESLQLGGNPGITDASVHSFSKVLKNGTLKRLRLENCSISKEGEILLQKFELDVTFIENVEQDRELREAEVESRETIGRRRSF